MDRAMLLVNYRRGVVGSKVLVSEMNSSMKHVRGYGLSEDSNSPWRFRKAGKGPCATALALLM